MSLAEAGQTMLDALRRGVAVTHYCSLCFDAIALPGLCESCESSLAQSPDECPAGGSHTFQWMVSELDTGGSPAGFYCSECAAPAPKVEVDW